MCAVPLLREWAVWLRDRLAQLSLRDQRHWRCPHYFEVCGGSSGGVDEVTQEAGKSARCASIRLSSGGYRVWQARENQRR